MSTRASSLLAAAVPFVAGGMGAQLHAFLQELASQSGLATQIPPLSRGIFVDPLTTTPTSLQNGSIAAPFATVAAAIASPLFVPNVAIFLAPGVYTENIVIPPTARNVGLVGLATNAVQLAPTAGDAITYQPTGPTPPGQVPLLFLQGLQLQAPGQGYVVDGSGLASPDAIFVAQNVNDNSLGGSVATGLQFGRMTSGTGSALHSWTHNGLCFFVGMQFLGGLTLDFDRASSGVVNSHTGFFLQGCFVQGLEHKNQARVSCNKGTEVETYSAVLSVFDGGPGNQFTPGVDFHGEVDSMDLGTLPDTTGLPAPHYDLSNMLCENMLTVNSADAVAGGAQIDARGTMIRNLSSTTSTQPLNIDVRAGFRPVLAFNAQLRLDRDGDVISGLAHPAAGVQAYAFGAAPLAALPPYPAGAVINATPVPVAPVAAVAEIPSVPAKSATGFSIDATSGAPLTFDVTVNRQHG